MRPPPSDAPSTPSSWGPSAPGEIEQLARRLRARKRRRNFLRLAGGAAVAVVAAGGLWGALMPRDDLAGLSCAQVHDMAGPYGRDELSPEMRDRVRRHVRHCPRCGPLFRSLGLEV